MDPKWIKRDPNNSLYFCKPSSTFERIQNRFEMNFKKKEIRKLNRKRFLENKNSSNLPGPKPTFPLSICHRNSPPDKF